MVFHLFFAISQSKFMSKNTKKVPVFFLGWMDTNPRLLVSFWFWPTLSNRRFKPVFWHFYKNAITFRIRSWNLFFDHFWSSFHWFLIDFWSFFDDFSLIFDHFYKYWLFIDFLIVSGCQKGHFFRTMGDPPWYWKNDLFSTWNPLALQENRKKRKPRKPTFWSFSSFFIKNWKNDQNWSKKCQKKSKSALCRRFFNIKKSKNVV